ncbi:hypothetical protein BHM03_00005302, partial [Ensete ventricosum]
MPKPAPAPDVGDDDDDFITNEVKRRLKELRKNSFMVLIPEEGHPEEEKEGSSSGVGGTQKPVMDIPGVGSTHFMPNTVSGCCLALRKLRLKKKQDEHPDNRKQLQLPQQEDERCRNLEAAYVAQVSLSWEALHGQYMQLRLKISSSQPEDGASYGYAAQLFQQFQILLQRFIENEPFEQGSRVEVYAHGRSWLSKLLQKLVTHGFELQKEMRVKELFKKKKGWRKKKRTWPTTLEEVQLLFALIDIEVISRVLRMARLSKEQLLWCDKKMSKLDLSGNRLCRDGSLLLFPLLT